MLTFLKIIYGISNIILWSFYYQIKVLQYSLIFVEMLSSKKLEIHSNVSVFNATEPFISMVKMVNLTLCIFYHNIKKKKKDILRKI